MQTINSAVHTIEPAVYTIEPAVYTINSGVYAVNSFRQSSFRLRYRSRYELLEVFELSVVHGHIVPRGTAHGYIQNYNRILALTLPQVRVTGR